MAQIRNTIRPLRLSDAGDIYEIMHMPNVLWGSLRLPSKSFDAWQATVERWIRDEQQHIFVVERQEKVVGIVRLEVSKGRRSHVGTLDIAVHDQFQGQGIGKMLMITALDLSDNWLNLRRLELGVFTDNERAIRLYKQFDFEIEGRLRFDTFRGGAYVDSYIMARFHPHGDSAEARAEALVAVPQAGERENAQAGSQP